MPEGKTVLYPAAVQVLDRAKAPGNFPGLPQHFLFLQLFRPLALLEANEHEVLAHQQRALDQHTIRGQELQHLLLAHPGQPVLQPHGFIQQPAGVEKFLQRQSAALVPPGKLLIGGIFQLDIAKLVGNLILVQPFSCLLAGGTFGVANQSNHLFSS